MIRSNRFFTQAIVLSCHVQTRMQQRAIPEWVITLLYDLADPVEAGGGCAKHSFSACSWAEAQRELGQEAAKLDRFRNAYIIVAGNGSIVTAARTH